MDLDKSLGFYPTKVRASAPSRSQKEARMKKPKTQSVGSLHPESTGVSCIVKIVDEPKEVESNRKNGSVSKFWEVTCGDATGQVVLSLTAKQKEDMAKDVVVFIRNASIRMVKGFMRLVVDKWGKFDFNTQEAVDEIGFKNMSSIEYELRW